MNNLNYLISIVKDQVRYCGRQKDRAAQDKNPKSVHKFEALGQAFAEIQRVLEQQQNGTASLSFDGDRIGFRVGDLSDLPPELRAELRVTDEMENQLLDVLNNKLGGTGTVDELLVQLFRTYGRTETRAKLLSKLHRMGKRGLLGPVRTKRGLYSTDESVIELSNGHEDEEGDD